MSKTIIYSCGRGVTANQLMESTDAKVNWHFPEVIWNGWLPIPLTQEEQVEISLRLIGKTITTVSETIILTILREVRIGNLDVTDVELYCDGQRVEISPSGLINDPWADDFSRPSLT